MKKKVISILLCMVLSVGLLAGCGSSDTAKTETDTDTKKEETVSDEDTITVGVSLLNNAHVFYNNIEAALEEEAASSNIDLIIQDAAGDSNKQLSQVQDFITQGVDAIILCPTNSAGSKSMVELADAAGIPTFTMDVQSDGEVVTHVATDNYKGGELAAEWLVGNVLPEKKGEVAVITYSEIEGCVNREEGFTEWLGKNAPDIKVVDVQNYSGDQGKAAEVMQNMLLKHKDLDAVFCVGDPAAVGAMSSIDAVSGDVKVIGFDGNPEAIDAIASGGNWVADIAQDPASIGTQTLKAVRTYLGGGEVDKLIPISPTVIDATNAK
jgi:ribose transport system substrate-binding protein